MYVDSPRPMWMGFEFSDYWVDLFGLGLQLEVVQQIDGQWVQAVGDGSSAPKDAPAQDGPPSANDGGVPLGQPTPIADPSPVHVGPIELTGAAPDYFAFIPFDAA